MKMLKKVKNEVNNVFTQTEFDNSSENGISTNPTFLASHGYFSNPEKISPKPANHYSSLKFNVDDEFSPKK